MHSRQLPTLAATLTLLWTGSASAQQLWLSLPAPADPCTSNQFALALSSLRPQLMTLVGHSDGAADIEVAVERSGATWSLSVQAPGQVELRRVLPSPANDCGALSEAAAFMIARYLQDIDWREAPEPVRPVAALSAPVETSVSRWQPVTSAAIESTLGQTGVLPALELDLGVRHGPWEVDLGTAVAWPGRITALSGDSFHDVFQIQAARLEVAGGRRLLPLGPGALRVDLVPGIELNWTADVTYARASPGFRSRAIAGARASWELPLGDRLAFAVRLEGRALLGLQPQAPAKDDHDSDDPLPVDADCGLSLALSYVLF